MSWTIKVSSNQFTYYFNNKEFTADVSLKEEKFSKENSLGYQEPNDDVLNSTFFSETEHGYFEWSVRSVRTGFNTYAEIECEEMTRQPEKIENYDQLEFFVENL
ncbi:hypothetical protein [uncultured Xanthomonas sp.]|uniref:hypothetical protein n=1 Tax=uncultured Xanthomonas sp. TaxID=152831 RepID=UPI0025D4FC94|nr:hypothetical protein [uncultured Xanthomonas sp.]